MTVLKQADDKQPQLDALTALLEHPDVDDRTRKRIQDEIWAVRSGIQGERDAAYEIDFQFASRESYAVIHDLRLEFEGRVAQIDHLLINRVLDVWVCETKAFSQGVKIDENGEWYRYGGKFAHGMASPVKQNARHVEVLRDVFSKGAVRLPRRLGVSLQPTFHPVVLISNDARIDRPKTKAARLAVDGLETVIKVEQLIGRIERSFDERNAVSFLAKVVSVQTVRDLAKQLVAMHTPASFDWAARYGFAPTAAESRDLRTTQIPPAAEAIATASSICESCGHPVSAKVAAFAIEHGDEFNNRLLCFDCQRTARRARARRSS